MTIKYTTTLIRSDGPVVTKSEWTWRQRKGVVIHDGLTGRVYMHRNGRTRDITNWPKPRGCV